jgi:hypothetical protein
MATTTTRLSLRKPEDSTPDDPVDVTTDISDNMDKIDTAAGMERVAAFPGAPYIGKPVMRSDQDDRLYVYNGTSWLEFSRVHDVARMYASASGIGLPRSTDNVVTLNTSKYDTFTGISVANNRIILKKIGVWRVSLVVRMDNFNGITQPAYAAAWITLNGVDNYASSGGTVSANNQVILTSGSDDIITTAITDYLQLVTRFTTGTVGATYDVPIQAGLRPSIAVEFIRHL